MNEIMPEKDVFEIWRRFSPINYNPVCKKVGIETEKN
jgi:hypothetical protein